MLTQKQPVLGILGGGQLALMLAQSGDALGIKVRCLVGSHETSVLQAAETVQGDVNDPAVLRHFLSDLDYLTFENEFISIPNLTKYLPSSVKVFPSLDNIALIQNKETQKRFLIEKGFPVAEGFSVNWQTANNLGIQDCLEFIVAKQRSDQFVMKWAQFGYDGKGTLIYPDQKHKWLEFFEHSQKLKTSIVVEQCIHFKRELAVLVARSEDECVVYPLVGSFNTGGVCRVVTGPVTGLVQKSAQAIGVGVAHALNYIGVLAIEFFETQNGQLIINELAPRVHNSGHYSQVVPQMTSQFENHLRSGLRLRLGNTEAGKTGFFMGNLIGYSDDVFPLEPNLDFIVDLKSRVGEAMNIKFQNYKKIQTRPGRKMAHLVVGSLNSLEQLSDLMIWWNDWEPKWQKNLK